MATGGDPAAVAEEMAGAVHAAGGRLPGFGHPVHRPLDPRAERILELADARGVSGPHVRLARQFRDAAATAWGKPLTMNVSMPIAAVMLDLGFPASAVKAVPILARTAGLLAHLAEEQEQPARLPHGRGRRGGDPVRATAGGRVMLTADVETRPWEEQLALDDAAYREQLAYLFERSRVLSGEAGRSRVRDAGRGRRARDIAELPLTEKHELRATCTPENPIGAHLCATPPEIVRIYSTSGTTGVAQLHPAHGGRPRQLGHRLRAQLRGVGRGRRPAHRLHVQRGPVRGGRGARRVRPHRAVPHPRRHRQHRAAHAGDRAAPARGRRAHALLRRLPDRVGGRAGRRPRRLERRARARRRRARRRRAGLPRAARGRAGAHGSPRRWASATSACRCGASARRRTACTWARAASSTRS